MSHIDVERLQSSSSANSAVRRKFFLFSTAKLQIMLAVFIVALMYFLNATQGNLVMPAPHKIAQQLSAMIFDGSIPKALGQSLTVLFFGFALSALTGVLGGIVLGGFPKVGRVMEPFVNAINATPGAAFIPLVIVWFGLYTEAKVVVVWNAAFFPILLNTAAGIANANKDFVEMAQSFGAKQHQVFWSIIIPDALPQVLTGLRIGVAVSTVGTVIAELTMAQSGLGGLLTMAGNRFQMDKYFAVVIVLMILGIMITAVLRAVERYFGRWRIVQQQGR